LLPFFGLYQLIINLIIFICNKMYYLYDIQITQYIYLYEYFNNSEHRAKYIDEMPEYLKIYIEKYLLN